MCAAAQHSPPKVPSDSSKRTRKRVEEGPRAGGGRRACDHHPHPRLAGGEAVHHARLRPRARPGSQPRAEAPRASGGSARAADLPQRSAQRWPAMAPTAAPAGSLVRRARRQAQPRPACALLTSSSSVLTGIPVTTMSHGPSGSFRASVLRRDSGRAQCGGVGAAPGSARHARVPSAGWAGAAAGPAARQLPAGRNPPSPGPADAPPAPLTWHPSPCRSS